MSLLSKWRVRLGHIFALVLLVLARPNESTLAVGLAVAFAGEAFRIYSAGCIDKNQAIARSGPYRWTRNPLYFGSFLLYLGFSIASGSLGIIAFFVPAFYFVYNSTILLEEEYLSGKFGAEYDAFLIEVPRFFPMPRPGGAPGGFTWSQVRVNHEHEGAIGFVIVSALLAAEFAFRFQPLREMLEALGK